MTLLAYHLNDVELKLSTLFPHGHEPRKASLTSERAPKNILLSGQHTRLRTSAARIRMADLFDCTLSFADAESLGRRSLLLCVCLLLFGTLGTPWEHYL